MPLFRQVFLTLLTVMPMCLMAQPKSETIKLTGYLRETITIKVAGKTLTANSLPLNITLMQEEIPATIEIESPNYDYQDIYVKKYTREDFRIARQTQEPIDRTYVVASEKRAVAAIAPAMQSATAHPTPAKASVPASEVNNAPIANSGKSANTFAVIIANEDYQIVAPVAMARNDGEIFKKYCTNTLGIPEENVSFYPNATFGQMRKALKDLKDIAEIYEGDINLIFYYAGHGIPDNATKDAYILPTDADGEDMLSCFSMKDVYKHVNDLHLNNAIFFLDACFSGAQRGGDMIVAARGVAMVPKEEKPNGNTIVFTAASGQEAAYPYEREGHGLFTYFLLKKMQETKGDVTLGELAEYIQDNVERKSIVVNKKRQTPCVSFSEAMRDTWKGMKLIQPGK